MLVVELERISLELLCGLGVWQRGFCGWGEEVGFGFFPLSSFKLMDCLRDVPHRAYDRSLTLFYRYFQCFFVFFRTDCLVKQLIAIVLLQTRVFANHSSVKLRVVELSVVREKRNMDIHCHTIFCYNSCLETHESKESRYSNTH